jgi:Ca2+-binding RTX toxin-like protein
LEITAVTAANDVLNLDAAGVETLTLSAKNTSNSLTLDVAGVTATTGSTVGITSSGGGALVFNAINTGTTSIDGSTMTGAITVDAAQRGNGAMTIKGGTGGDAIEMENAADVLSGGLGTDTLSITHTGILGGIAVDLTATDQVSTFDTVANAAVQGGFENVDVSGYTNFGASITGTSGANTLVGTASVDSIVGGLGADIITGGAGNDVINITEATASIDKIVLNSTTGTDVITGFTVTTDDVIQIDVSAVTSQLVDGAAADEPAGATIVIEDISADETVIAGENIFNIVASIADAAALKVAMESGAAEITLAATATVNEDIVVVADNGTDTFIYLANIDGVTAAAIDTVTITTLAQLVGISDSDTLDAANFAFI